MKRELKMELRGVSVRAVLSEFDTKFEHTLTFITKDTFSLKEVEYGKVFIEVEDESPKLKTRHYAIYCPKGGHIFDLCADELTKSEDHSATILWVNNHVVGSIPINMAIIEYEPE